MIQLQKVILHRLKMRLKNPFSTHLGVFQNKEFFIIEAVDSDGLAGFGESVAFTTPWYTEETVVTTDHVMVDFLIPLLLKQPIEHPDEVFARFRVIRRNQMAKAALEGAVWDLYARKNNISLSAALGGTKSEIAVGISIGIQNSVEELLSVIERTVKAGYRRIKVKIKPGWDVNVIREIRSHFPSIPLMVDANSAYSLADINHLKKMDEFNLMMIEQPLAHDDIYDHAILQRELRTPICLDESITSYDDARHAIAFGSCKVINIKIGRVGGLSEAKRIHDLCHTNGVPVWCGGMLEAGVGRAHNIALTTLTGFTMPGDTAGSSNYWERDIIKPEVVVDHGVIHVPDKPGIGYDIDRKALELFTVETRVFEA